MKRFNIVFLFIILSFISLGKNINLNTSINASTNNISSVVSDDPQIPYVDSQYITIDETGNISYIDPTAVSAGAIYIPSIVNKDGKDITVVSIGSGVKNKSIFGTGILGTTMDVTYNNTIFEIFLPKTLRTIGNWSFEACDSLNKVYIPEYITNIGTSIFQYCRQMKEAYILCDITALPGWFFENGNATVSLFYLGNTPLTSIGNSVISATGQTLKIYFKNEEIYTKSKAYIPNPQTNVTLQLDFPVQYSSDYNIIYNSSDNLNGKLLKITVTEITDFVIPSEINGVIINQVTPRSFTSNYYITSITFSEGFKYITDGTSNNDGAFARMYNLKSVYLPSTIASIGKFAFDTSPNILFYYNDKVNTFPDSLQKVYDYAFASNPQITNLTFGTGLVVLSDNSLSYLTNLEYITINSRLTTVSTTMAANGNTPSFKIIFDSFELYSSNLSLFSTYGTRCTYPVNVQYQNTSLFNNPSFSSEFQDVLDTHKIDDIASNVNNYLYYAGDTLDMPSSISNFNVPNADDFVMYKTYSNNSYSDPVTASTNSTTILAKGTVGNSIIIYCNVFTNPIDNNNVDKYSVSVFNSDNISSSSIFNINDLGKEYNLRFTNDANTGITGLPVSGYKYKFDWYVKNNSTFQSISNNNSDSSVLSIFPEYGLTLNTIYRCTLTIYNSVNILKTMSYDISLSFIKEDMNVVIYNQVANDATTLSSTYGVDYVVNVSDRTLTENEMKLYFGSDYGLVSRLENDLIIISFYGTLQEPYASTYQVITPQTGILTTKTNSTNLILISVTSGLFLVEVIIFIIVIFKQKTRTY